ncbi:Membrane protein OS=Streptomyces fumanus OX=67302 GN=GCM10018772_48600 PE=4 SV=1 [Streptomyces fumanus]
MVLGPADAGLLASVLGAPPPTTPVARIVPGRGSAQLGAGPVHRLQVPATPDPYDDAAGRAHREAVLELLPPRTTPADGEHVPEVPGGEQDLTAPADQDPREPGTRPAPDDTVPEPATGAEPAPAGPVPVLTEAEPERPRTVPTLGKPEEPKKKRSVPTLIKP